MTKDICIVMPAYNEVRNIVPVVRGLREQRLDVVVVDDGSTDGTAQAAGREGAFVIRHDKRCGKGASLQDGFRHALASGYQGVIAMDSDGQHDVADVQRFLDKRREDPVSVVTGNRMSDTVQMPPLRRWTNRLMSWVISTLCRQPIPDTQCGYRYIHSDILRALTLTSHDFEIETEVLIQASRRGYRVHSVPVRTIYGDETSKIRPVKDTFRFFAYLFREFLRPHP